MVKLDSLLPSNNSVQYFKHVKFDVYDNSKINQQQSKMGYTERLERFQIKWKKIKLDSGTEATKELIYFHDIINILIVAYSLDHYINI